MADITWGGTLYEFTPARAQRTSCCKIDHNKFVVIYGDADDGSKLKARVGVVSDFTITWGPISQISVGDISAGFGLGLCQIDTNKFAVVYKDAGAGSIGFTRVGVVTGDTIAWGAAVNFDADTRYISACQLDTNKYAISYSVTLLGKVCICSVAGDVITAGVPQAFDPANKTCCLSWETDSFILAYFDSFAVEFNILLVTCIGLVPTFGAVTQFDAAGSTPYEGMAKLTANSFAISWNSADGNRHKLCIGTVAAGVITQGPVTILNPSLNGWISVEALDPSHFVVIYKDEVAGTPGAYNICQFSGTTITPGPKLEFKADSTTFVSCSIIDGRLVVTFQDEADPTDHGEALIGQFIFLPTVTTNPATGVIAHQSTLNGTLDDDGGEACDCGFEWGETIAYGNTTPTDSKTTGQTFSQVIIGLDVNKTYHFRAFASNAAGTSYGADRTFTTQELLIINRAYALSREEL